MNGKGDKDRTKNIKQFRSNWENLFAKAQKKKDEKDKDFLAELIDTLPEELQKKVNGEPDAED